MTLVCDKYESGDLWKALVASKPLSSAEESDQEDVDVVLMQALGECYANANTWETRRQILSIVADKFTFRTLKKWFPELTKWHFTVAREHALLHGRGTPSSKNNPNANVCNPEAS